MFVCFYISTPGFTNLNSFQTKLISSALQESSRLYLKKESSDQTALTSLQVPSCNTLFKSSCLQVQTSLSVVITGDAEVAQHTPPLCAPCVCVCVSKRNCFVLPPGISNAVAKGERQTQGVCLTIRRWGVSVWLPPWLQPFLAACSSGGEQREEGPRGPAANSGEPHVAGMQSVESNHA